MIRATCFYGKIMTYLLFYLEMVYDKLVFNPVTSDNICFNKFRNWFDETCIINPYQQLRYCQTVTRGVK